MTDHEILSGFGNNKEPTFKYIYKEFGPKVLGHVMKNSGTRTDAEEVLQITMIKVWKNVTGGKYKSKGKFDAYFFSVAVYTWHEILRKRKRANESSLTEKEYGLADKGEDMLILKMVKEDTLNFMHEAIQELRPDYQELVRQHYFEKIRIRDLAKSLGVKENHLTKKLIRCRKKIKEIIIEKQQAAKLKSGHELIGNKNKKLAS